MMNILICDDMKSDAEKLDTLILDSGFDVNTAIFDSGNNVLAHIRSGAKADACFLDIVMPEMSGIVLAEKLREDGFTGEIIFLTTSNEYAAESYAVDAFSYLVKPAAIDSVRGILRKLRARRRKSGPEDGLLVKSGASARLILFQDISYVEAMLHKVHFRLTNGLEEIANATFRKIVGQLLNDERFVQCHRSFVVNMNDITAISGWKIILRSGRNLPISRSYPDVKKKFAKWILRIEQ
ncbi:MAG: LytTR family DNA-binding domain-containing protein [Desulfovibrionaceae bacterium]|nr:LytTR family DNA-binding domain-containing protein [Desulfovibrionaceae bacterium]